MEVWIPPQEDTIPLLNKYEVKECGLVAPPGHFGWFVPEVLARPDDSWLVFSKLESASRFAIDETYLPMVKNYTMDPRTWNYYCRESFCQHGMYIPEQCQKQQNAPNCALLLAEYPDVTRFVKEHIDQMKLYVKVVWVGPNLRHLSKYLTREYMQLSRNASASTENRYFMRNVQFFVINFRHFRFRSASAQRKIHTKLLFVTNVFYDSLFQVTGDPALFTQQRDPEREGIYDDRFSTLRDEEEFDRMHLRIEQIDQAGMG